MTSTGGSRHVRRRHVPRPPDGGGGADRARRRGGDGFGHGTRRHLARGPRRTAAQLLQRLGGGDHADELLPPRQDVDLQTVGSAVVHRRARGGRWCRLHRSQQRDVLRPQAGDRRGALVGRHRHRDQDHMREPGLLVDSRRRRRSDDRCAHGLRGLGHRLPLRARRGDRSDRVAVGDRHPVEDRQRLLHLVVADDLPGEHLHRCGVAVRRSAGAERRTAGVQPAHRVRTAAFYSEPAGAIGGSIWSSAAVANDGNVFVGTGPALRPTSSRDTRTPSCR